MKVAISARARPLPPILGWEPRPELRQPTELHVERGTILFRQGDQLKVLYQVASGWMKLSRMSLSGRELIVELLFPGDYFDLHNLLDSRPTSFTAASLTSQPAQLKCLIGSQRPAPALLRALHVQLAEQMRRQHDMMAAMAGERVEHRILLVLQLLARRSGRQVGPDLLVPMPITRQELAALTGSSVENSIRVMTSLHRRGLITLKERDFCCCPTFVTRPLV